LAKKREFKRYAWLKDPEDKTIKELEPQENVPICNPDRRGWGKRQCVCGALIKANWTLCPTCLKYYGNDRSTWPHWLKEWVSQYQTEVRNEQDHRELELIDGVQYCNAGGGNKIKAHTNSYETSRDDLNKYRSMPRGALNENQLYNRLSDSDKAAIYPGEYPNAANGRSKYDKREFDQYTPEEQSEKIWAIDDRVKGTEVPTSEYTAKDNEIFFKEAAKMLSPRERQVLDLYRKGYKQQEIAEKMRISQQMVSKIYNRVVKKLKKRSN